MIINKGTGIVKLNKYTVEQTNRLYCIKVYEKAIIFLEMYINLSFYIRTDNDRNFPFFMGFIEFLARGFYSYFIRTPISMISPALL